jgi:acyl-CoA hydrolase
MNQEVVVEENTVEIQEASVENRFDNDEARADLEYINTVIKDNMGEPLLFMLTAVQQSSLQSEAVKESLNADIAFLQNGIRSNKAIMEGLAAIKDVAIGTDVSGCSDFVRNNFFDLARRAEGILGFVQKPE